MLHTTIILPSISTIHRRLHLYKNDYSEQEWYLALKRNSTISNRIGKLYLSVHYIVKIMQTIASKITSNYLTFYSKHAFTFALSSSCKYLLNGTMDFNPMFDCDLALIKSIYIVNETVIAFTKIYTRRNAHKARTRNTPHAKAKTYSIIARKKFRNLLQISGEYQTNWTLKKRGKSNHVWILGTNVTSITIVLPNLVVSLCGIRKRETELKSFNSTVRDNGIRLSTWPLHMKWPSVNRPGA